MKWIGERVSFVDDKNKLTIVIYPEKSGFTKAMMGAWVSMWLVIGSTIVWSYFNLKLTDQEVIILIVFMTFWAYYAVRVIRSFFWIMWGKELIKIDEVALHYKKSIRKYGKSIPFFFENIKKIALFQPKTKSVQSVWEASPWIRGGERIEFEYQGKVIRFARKLDEKDSKVLFNLITKRVEEKVRKSNH